MARVTFDLRGPGSIDDAQARTVAERLEADELAAGTATLAAKIRASLEEPKRRKPIPLDPPERSALLTEVSKALDGGDLNGDLRWLQQSLSE